MGIVAMGFAIACFIYRQKWLDEQSRATRYMLDSEESFLRAKQQSDLATKLRRQAETAQVNFDNIRLSLGRLLEQYKKL